MHAYKLIWIPKNVCCPTPISSELRIPKPTSLKITYQAPKTRRDNQKLKEINGKGKRLNLDLFEVLCFPSVLEFVDKLTIDALFLS